MTDGDGVNIVLEALEQGETLMQNMLEQGEKLLDSDAVLAIGAGLFAAGSVRYIAQHPELIETALEQIGNSLEVGASSASGAGADLGALAGILGPLLVGGGAVATAIPGVPPPP